MKMRSDCVLQNLTKTQLDQIFELLSAGSSYRQVRLTCAKPPPEGLGLEIHHTTLVRFFKSERRRRHAEDLAESKFDDLNADNLEQLLQNVRVELGHACYDLAHQPDASSVNTLARITHRLDFLRLEQQRLALERDFLAEKIRQFNFNAAKEAAIYAHKIRPILTDKTIDLETKVWQVSDVIFGPKPNPSLPHSSNNHNQFAITNYQLCPPP